MVIANYRKSAKWTWLLLFPAFIFFQLPAPGQDIPGYPVPDENFGYDRFVHYTTKEGLSSNHIRKLQYDHRGFIWVGTLSGLNRFDGHAFEKYEVRQAPPFHLPQSAIFYFSRPDSMHFAISQRDGVHLVDTRNLSARHFFVTDTSYFSYYVNHAIDAVTLPSDMVGFLSLSGFYVADQFGKIVFRADRFKAGNEKRFNVRYGTKIFRLSEDELLIAGVDSSTTRVDYYNHSLKTIRKIEVSDPELGIFARPGKGSESDYLKLGAHQFMILHYGDRLIYFDSKTRKTIEAPLPFDSDETGWITSLCRLNDSTFAFNSMKAGFFLAYLDRKNQKILINTHRYFADRPCSTLLTDGEGRLWVGTLEGLFMQKKEKSFFQSSEIPPPGKGKTGGWLTSAFRHRDKLYIGTEDLSHGLIVADTARMRILRRIPIPESLGFDIIFSIQNYLEDTLWLGTDKGLVWLDPKKESWGRVKDQDGKPVGAGGAVIVYPPDSHGNIWILRRWGGMAARYHPASRTFTYLTTGPPYSLPFKRIGQIVYDAYGDIWFSGEGLARWNTREQRIDTLIRQFDGKYHPGLLTASCTADEKGNLWLNTHGTLFEYRIRTGKLIPHSLPGIPETIDAMPLRMYGDILWFAADNRIYGYHPANRQLAYFDHKDSELPAMQTNNFIFHDRESDCYYVPGMKHIHKFSGIQHKTGPTKKQVLVTSVETADSVYYFPESDLLLKRRPASGFLVRFTIPDYNPYQSYDYYYKIGESEWIGPGQQQSIYFNSNQYGPNPVEIKAVDKQGTTYTTSLAVVISPPWWRTTAFRILVATLLAGTVYGIFRYRLNAQLRLKEIQIRASVQAQEKERERLSRDLHDGVGASLSMLKMYLSSFGDKSIPQQELQDRSQKLLDGSVEEIRRMIYDMHPKNLREQGLSGALHQLIQQVRKGSSLDISLTGDDITFRLDEITEINLYRIFQELIQNTLKHAEATQIAVTVENTAEALLFCYRDNGKGFDSAGISPGNGLLNIQNRVMLLKGEAQLRSAKGAGMEARISVPLQKGR